MGSMIHLAVGRLEIDWGKNHGFTDHSALYQVDDVGPVPYYYADDSGNRGGTSEDGDWSIYHEYKEGLSKPLSQVIDRINLLGHTGRYCELEFEYLSILNDFDMQKFSFDQLTEALTAVDVQTISADYGEGEAIEKFFRRQIFPKLDFDKIVDDPRHVAFHTSLAMENLSPYTILQLLANNQSATNLPVNWAYADLAENGWANRSEFVRTLDPSNKFLIVTEGSSDVKILKKSFSLLKPHIADFFYYVDMQEGYPFSGTGNLINFVKGLISISVQNNILILFDNDAEGVASYNKCKALNIPSNMQILKLPDLKDFEQFQTIGPNGKYLANINGTAASIECYLDLKDKAEVRWNNYNTVLNRYQGELIAKDRFKRDYLDQTKKVIGYSYNKIEAVLEMIINNCIEMKEIPLINTLGDLLVAERISQANE